MNLIGSLTALLQYDLDDTPINRSESCKTRFKNYIYWNVEINAGVHPIV